MKNSGVCPKCGCTRIVGPYRASGVTLGLFATATFQAFLCSECGYAELYSDKMGLENVKRLGKIYEVPHSEVSQSSQPPEQRVCLFCNTPIQSDEVICPECGKNI